MSIATQIVCDGCAKTVSCGSGRERKHAHVVRSMLKDQGWRIDETPEGDLCESCRPPRNTKDKNKKAPAPRKNPSQRKNRAALAAKVKNMG